MVDTMVLVLAISGLFAQQTTQPGRGSRMRSYQMVLKGTASGGNLALVEAYNRNPSWISIETKPGETAQVVLERMAQAINEHDPFDWSGSTADGAWVRVEDGTLGPFPGFFGCDLFAGTETGLGIPPPPKSVSCSYHPDADEIVMTWENPPGGYDHIFVHVDGFAGHLGRDSGNLTEYRQNASELAERRMNRNNPGIENLDIGVIGIRGGIRSGIPSSAATITFRSNGQEELSGHPFSAGVAPNWTAWSSGDQSDAVAEQKPRPHEIDWINYGNAWRPPDKIKVTNDGKVLVFRNPRTFIQNGAEKPFIQLIKTPSPEVVAGVYRKFLGLTPGHTYRLSARLTTMDMDAAEGDWSFSLHVTPNSPDKATLTVQQLAGLAPLPDGSSGATAGQVALYQPGVTTRRALATTAPTGRKLGIPSQEFNTALVTGDVRLPEGVDSITVWVRHQAAHSTGVGLDWVRLEDVTGK